MCVKNNLSSLLIPGNMFRLGYACTIGTGMKSFLSLHYFFFMLHKMLHPHSYRQKGEEGRERDYNVPKKFRKRERRKIKFYHDI